MLITAPKDGWNKIKVINQCNAVVFLDASQVIQFGDTPITRAVPRTATRWHYITRVGPIVLDALQKKPQNKTKSQSVQFSLKKYEYDFFWKHFQRGRLARNCSFHFKRKETRKTPQSLKKNNDFIQSKDQYPRWFVLTTTINISGLLFFPPFSPQV